MVKYRTTRRLRPAFYQVSWNGDALYMHSRISAIIMRDAWVNMAIKYKASGVVELNCVLGNKMNKLYDTLDVVSLLNGTWEATLLSKHSFEEGVLVNVVTNPKSKHLLTRCNKLRVNNVYFNNDMKKTLEIACMDTGLMNTLFKAPSANVFVAAVKLIIPDSNEYKQKIQRHARDIYYVLRKPERKPTAKPRKV